MVKAYQSDHEDYERLRSIVVYAENSRKAKNLAFSEWSGEHDVEFIDVRVKRLPELDDKENLSELEKALILVRDCGWYYIFDDVEYDEENINQLEELIESRMKKSEI